MCSSGAWLTLPHSWRHTRGSLRSLWYLMRHPTLAQQLEQPRFRGFLWSGVLGSPPTRPGARGQWPCAGSGSQGQTLSLGTLGLILPPSCFPRDTMPIPLSRLSLRLFPAALSTAGNPKIRSEAPPP